jgi:hypothetical protein
MGKAFYQREVTFHARNEQTDDIMNLKVKANIGKNRLYFTFSGRAVKEEMDKLYTDVRFCVSDLKPGYDVISDFSGCSLMDISGMASFRKIMNFLISKGVGEVVRIVHRESVFLKQILNLSSRICGYKPIYAFTFEEAEEKLEKSVKRNGIRFHINHLTVEYIANDSNGKGTIVNLSVSGCAVESATLPVTADAEISIKMTFTSQQDVPSDEFIIKARVVRASGETFAAEFKGLEDDRKDQLWKCLINESQRGL